MKHEIILGAALLASISITSCGEGANSETTTDTVVAGTTTDNAGSAPVTQVTYYDLRSGNAVTKDEASGKYVDESGNASDFYVDPQAGDTFSSSSGQNVNNSLIHEGDNWRVDDAKIKIDGDEAKMKTDEGKVKVNDEKIKIKTDESKTKIIDHDKDGSSKTKIKEK